MPQRVPIERPVTLRISHRRPHPQETAMARIPEPTQTPDGPAYEGRLLARPDDEVVDQGAGFDLRTLVSRRGVLGLIGVGAGTMVLAACAPTSSATPRPTATAAPSAAATPAPTPSATSVTLPSGEIPDETAGPYPGDGSNGPDVLEDSGIVRADIRTDIGGTTAVDGVALTFTLTVTDMANGDVPFENVAVYAWHCDAAGRYSMYSSGVEDNTWLRGVQVADANGQVTFTSVIPGCYAGRWPHIHFEVYPERRLDHQLDERHRHVAAGPPRRHPRRRLRPIGVRRVFAEPLADHPRQRQRLR
jgi:protocatechuate 3,4-dioxygenase beta subunit